MKPRFLGRDIMKFYFFWTIILLSIPTSTFSHEADTIVGQKTKHDEILPQIVLHGNHGFRYKINFNNQVKFRWSIYANRSLSMELQGYINEGWMAIGICEPLLRDINTVEMDGCDVIFAYNGMRMRPVSKNSTNSTILVPVPLIYNYYTEGNNLVEPKLTAKNEDFFTRKYELVANQSIHSNPNSSTIVRFVSNQDSSDLHFKRPVLIIYAINKLAVVKEETVNKKIRPMISTIGRCIDGHRGHTTKIIDMYEPNKYWNSDGRIQGKQWVNLMTVLILYYLYY